MVKYLRSLSSFIIEQVLICHALQQYVPMYCFLLIFHPHAPGMPGTVTCTIDPVRPTKNRTTNANCQCRIVNTHAPIIDLFRLCVGIGCEVSPELPLCCDCFNVRGGLRHFFVWHRRLLSRFNLCHGSYDDSGISDSFPLTTK